MATKTQTKIHPDLQKIIKLFNVSRIMTPDDIKQILSGVIGVIKRFKADNDKLGVDTKGNVEKMTKQFMTDRNNLMTAAQGLGDQTKKELTKEVKQLVKQHNLQLKKIIGQIRAIMPKDGKDADEARIVQMVLEKIKLPENKPFILTAEEIFDAIKTAEESEDNKIPWSRIKDAPHIPTKSMGGGSTRTRITSANFVISDDPVFGSYKKISIPIQPTAPADPVDGMLWIDSA